MKLSCPPLVFLPLVFLSALSFSPRERRMRPATTTALRSSMINVRNETGNIESEKENSQEEKWSLELDWILQDSVPRYTVSSSSSKERRASTFWNQLKHATPEFESFTENELEKRYHVLFHKAVSNASDTMRTLPCGPSPSVLSDWWVLDDKNIMGGTDVSNGSMVWFHLHSGGKLENKRHKLDLKGMDTMLYTPGGFVETKDGLIYELGPAALDHKMPEKESVDELIGTVQQRGYGLLLNPARLLDRHARKLILTGITVSSALPATLAFGIGQQMASLPPSSPSPSVSSQDSCPYVTIIRAQSLQSSAYSQGQEIPIAEQRARQEFRVLREKRASTELQERIQQDEEKLSALQKEEATQEGAAPIAEQRARQEFRVLREKRANIELQERIQRDEEKLSALQKEEAIQEGAALGYSQ